MLKSRIICSSPKVWDSLISEFPRTQLPCTNNASEVITNAIRRRPDQDAAWCKLLEWI